MKKACIAAALLGASLIAGTASAQDQPLRITFLHQSTVDDVFWQAVNRGMQDACDKYGAECEMIFNRQESDLAGLMTNIEAAMVTQPDAILLAIASDTVFDEIVEDMIEAGIIVIGVNQDDRQGALGNARMSYVGQDDEGAGYNIALNMSRVFPEEGPIEILIGVNMPGATWSEDRANGIERFMADYAADNPDREVIVRRLDVGVDGGVVATRVMADLQVNPNVTAYVETGYFVYTVAAAMRENGADPDDMILAGFDIIPPVLEELKSGYIDFQADQQPYLQGYLPVIQVSLMRQYGLSAWSVNTGAGIVTPEDADELEQYIALGVR